MPETLTVKYSCPDCGLDKQLLRVPTRQHDTPISQWVETVGERCHLDHQIRSPLCQRRQLNLMIPMPRDAQWIGERGHVWVESQDPPAALPPPEADNLPEGEGI